jgi:hypothetical protein
MEGDEERLPSRSQSRASAKRARTESPEEGDELEYADEDSGTRIFNFISWFSEHAKTSNLTNEQITGLYNALGAISLDILGEDTIRMPISPIQTSRPPVPIPEAPRTTEPPAQSGAQQSARQTPRTAGPQADPTASISYAAAAASNNKNTFHMNTLPDLIQRVNKLRRDFPSITEEEAIRFATRRDVVTKTQKQPGCKGTAVAQGTKSNIVLLKPKISRSLLSRSRPT